jgi:hypothetical protein
MLPMRSREHQRWWDTEIVDDFTKLISNSEIKRTINRRTLWEHDHRSAASHNSACGKRKQIAILSMRRSFFFNKEM